MGLADMVSRRWAAAPRSHFKMGFQPARNPLAGSGMATIPSTGKSRCNAGSRVASSPCGDATSRAFRGHHAALHRVAADAAFS